MFQLCDAFVENCRRRIGQTRIDVARTLQSEFGSCILCVLEDVGSCLINRRRAGTRFIDDLTCVTLQRFKFVILIAHKRDPLYFFRDVESDKQQIKNAPVKEHLSQGRIPRGTTHLHCNLQPFPALSCLGLYRILTNLELAPSVKLRAHLQSVQSAFSHRLKALCRIEGHLLFSSTFPVI